MSKKNKIAFVAGWPPFDRQGEANYAANIVKEYKLVFPESEIIVYAHVKDKNNILGIINDDNGIKIRRVTNGNNFLERTIRSLFLGFYIIKDRCKIVHYQGVHTPLYGLLFGESMIFTFFLLKVFGKKQFYSLHSTWLKADLINLMKEKNKTKFLTSIFVLYYGFYLKSVKLLMNKFLIVSCGNKTIAVDEFVNEWNLTGNKLFKENHPCQNYKIDKIDYKSDLNINIEEGVRVILCLGYVRRDKGIHNLIQAFDVLATKYNNIRLIIGGETIGADGEKYYHELKNQITKTKNIGKINYLSNYISQDVFQYLFSLSTIVVVPYSRVIGPSGPVHYALGRSKIVVASNLGHNCNLEGEICLYDNSSLESLINALDKVLNNSEFVEEMQSKIELYRLENTWENMSKNYNNFYKE
jgi:glycosyltransferase involved in cell wall biosynthesis